MAESFYKTHEKVQFYFHEGHRIAKEKKDYLTAIHLTIKALKIVNGSKAFDLNYKYSKNYQLYRQLTLLAFKSELPKDALKYATLCNRPDFIADAYFENGQFEKSLLCYTALSEPYTIFPGWTWSPSDSLSRNKLPKVAKSFYYIIKEYPDKYTLDNIQEKFGWLYNQVVSRFGSLEDAFSYYKLYKKSRPEKRIKKNLLNMAQAKEHGNKFTKVLQLHQAFKELYLEKLDYVSTLLKQNEFKKARSELLNLFKNYKALETGTGTKIIGNMINIVDADLITDIAEIFLMNGEVHKALSWTSKAIEEHWRYVDYYLNLKFLLNEDLEGEDIIRIGFSSTFCTNVGSVINKRFYRPSKFAKRNIEGMINLCNVNLSNHKREISNCDKYLDYLSRKHINRRLSIIKCGRDDSYIHFHALFGGKYGKFNLDDDVTFQYIEDKLNINPKALYGTERGWVHISFSQYREFVQLISDLCTNCENQLRKEKGIPEIGCQWRSETEIYAFVKELLTGYEVTRHHSPTWLSPMHLDVYVPGLSLAIEYQGQQHFMPVDIFGGQEGYEKTKVRDNIKRKLCKQNGVILLYINHDDEEPEKIIVDFIEKIQTKD